MISADNILRAQACGRPGCVCARSMARSKGLTHCPSHDDAIPSLTVEVKDGKTLVYCFAGCTQDEVISNLRDKGLWPSIAKRGEATYIPPEAPAPLQPQATHSYASRGVVSPGTGCTLAQYAEGKCLPIDVLRALGLTDYSYRGSPAVRIPYLAIDGSEGPVAFRVARSGPNHFRWRSGDKPTLYGLWRLADARTAGYAILCEGPSDCQTLWHHNIPALGLPGAGNWREARDAHDLDGIDNIFVVIEPDKGGDAIKKWMATSSIRHRVRLLSLGEYKDPSDLYLADPGQFRDRWQVAMDSAVSWAEYVTAQEQSLQREAWERCRTLAEKLSILSSFSAELVKCGVVGEARAGELIYLILTSRLLDQPASGVVKGPSSSGKSFVLDQTLLFFPDNASHVLSAMSEKALAYSDEPLSHRVLVLYEAAGLQSAFASYLVRSLLSEGRLRYETVEKTKDGLRARLIEREGPTGLLMTTTAIRLHPENETRLLSIPVNDTADQTRAVMLAVAEEDAEPIDCKPWHALQTWLGVGEHRVSIPYAQALAEMIPPVAVRLRRDFRMVLTLVRAHALLHRATREKDRHGRIVATLEDYRVVLALVGDLVSAGVEATVSPTIRETVRAVDEIIAGGIQEAKVVQVATKLGLDKSPTLRRVRVTIDQGYLKNLEDKKGRPARLVLGDLMPEDLRVFPSVEELEGYEGCRVAVETEEIHTPSSTGSGKAEMSTRGTRSLTPSTDEVRF